MRGPKLIDTIRQPVGSGVDDRQPTVVFDSSTDKLHRVKIAPPETLARLGLTTITASADRSTVLGCKIKWS